MSLYYKKNTGSLMSIFEHIQNVSSLFFPTLESRVDLKEYANKIKDKANHFEAWHNDNIVGLVSYYINDQSNEVYVTNVSVLKEFQGEGIASKLMDLMLQDAQVKEKLKIRLCAYSDNEKVIRFYKKQGFYLGRKIGDQNEMIYEIHRTNPLVSICCVTYNHEPYICKCLDGFITQRTDFPFEVLIHDDASTDRTADIIREYETKYQDIIKPICQTENQYSKSVLISATYNWPRAKGRYVAMCEGDDYWVDPYKLQKQVDFMEANPEYGLVYTDYYNLLGSNFQRNSEIDSYKEHFEINAAPHIISDNIQRIGTATALLRKDLLIEICDKYGDDFYSGPGDNVVWFHFARLSKIKYLDIVSSVYRKAHGGATGTGDFTKRYSFLKKVYSQKRYLAERYGYPEIINKIDEKYAPNLYIMSQVAGDKEYTDKYHDVLSKTYPGWKFLQLYYRSLKLKVKCWLKDIVIHKR